MNAPLPHRAARRPASFKPVIPSPQSPEFAALVSERVSLIKRACLIADVVEVLGALPDPADMTVICAAYRAGCPDVALGPVLPRILEREWRQLADSEITAELNKHASGLVADDWIPGYVTAREIAIAQMEVRHG
ncbi:hypothetical protein FP568_13395 [Pandoraea pnomenusa]|uniref:hypothetical protein n=1 Tax=Pandoraea pnomenusa TaxID=93220 RepID=UPI001198BAA4|nr:hypothetical protein [Pandoraea pnomenusa]QDX22154.1 hypothetical protein FP568_13395 [Pandoraea pnomenusa]